MCYFVHIAVAKHHRDAALSELGAARLVAGEEEGPIRSLFSERDSVLHVTEAGHCSCAFYSSRPSTTEDDDERYRAKCLRKGWSSAKIDRALEARRTAGHSRSHGLQDAFVQVVARLVRRTGRVRLLAAWAGEMDTDEACEPPLQRTLAEHLQAEGSFPERTITEIVMDDPTE